MELVRHDIDIPFVRAMKPAAIFSAVLVVLGLAVFLVRGGLIFGIDFAGGTVIEIKFTEDIAIGDVRTALEDSNLGGSEIKHFGGADTVLISTDLSTGDLEGVGARVRQSLDPVFGGEGYTVERLEMVGPKVGSDLRKKGLQAVIFSCILILAYVTWRFEFKFALGGILALVHDIIISLALFTLLGKTFTLPVLAAVLTIAGYSINDSIVVFDRIRENLKRGTKKELSDIINLSINQTLSRTILTSLTVIVVVVALLLYGGEIIKDFSFILLIGVIVGTYSSIFIASPAVLFWQGRGIKLRK
jgi:preprotein translocase subunit SecF